MIVDAFGVIQSKILQQRTILPATQVIDHEQFEDARALLSGAVLIYERAQDESRLTKASRILSLITLVARANTAIRECRYADAEMLIGEGMTERASLVTERPFTLQPPNCMLFRGEGEAGARSVVLSRAHAAGNIDRLTALSLLNEGQFDAAAAAAASSAGRLVWCASQSGSGGKGDENNQLLYLSYKSRCRGALIVV